MLSFLPDLPAEGPLKVLCLGAHCDDIEIGAGGALLEWMGRERPLELHWAVFTSDEVRAREARNSAEGYFAGAGCSGGSVEIHDLPPSFLPAHWTDLKGRFFELRSRFEPHLVLTHRRADRHQDHNLVGELTWNTFRNHAILEYEIAKYEGDLGQPNVFVPVSEENVARKIQGLRDHFQSQADKPWFDENAFRALMRLRGIECNSPSGYAEAFHASKLCL
ncbi:MAG: PIG-L family deacetylase [Planctomycetes bacterium]|nr:PIG-L family deacetylase [Planctomycetota bacterium]